MKSTARWRILILLALAVGALVSSLGALLWGGQDWGGLALNLGSELAGALVTYGLLELFIGRRERREAERKELEAKKAALIAQMGSQVQDVAIAAAEELQRHGWLYDGSLRGARLSGANLQEAVLGGANLQGASLGLANLQRAGLVAADLQGANLEGANLQGAGLALTNLQGAWLAAANLRRARLDMANLQEAYLLRANLQEASLQGALLDMANLQEANLYAADLQGAELPDGTAWTPDTDMARFTNPNHPDFWRRDE